MNMKLDKSRIEEVVSNLNKTVDEMKKHKKELGDVKVEELTDQAYDVLDEIKADMDTVGELTEETIKHIEELIDAYERAIILIDKAEQDATKILKALIQGTKQEVSQSILNSTERNARAMSDVLLSGEVSLKDFTNWAVEHNVSYDDYMKTLQKYREGRAEQGKVGKMSDEEFFEGWGNRYNTTKENAERKAAEEAAARKEQERLDSIQLDGKGGNKLSLDDLRDGMLNGNYKASELRDYMEKFGYSEDDFRTVMTDYATQRTADGKKFTNGDKEEITADEWVNSYADKYLTGPEKARRNAISLVESDEEKPVSLDDLRDGFINKNYTAGDLRDYMEHNGYSKEDYQSVLTEAYSDKTMKMPNGHTPESLAQSWAENWVDPSSAGAAFGIKSEEFKFVPKFNLTNCPSGSGQFYGGHNYHDGTGALPQDQQEAYQKYLYNLCSATGMDYPLLLAMLYKENTGYVQGYSAGCFGFTGHGSNVEAYSEGGYNITKDDVNSDMNAALMATFGTTDIANTSYGNLYYDAAQACEVVKAHIAGRSGDVGSGMRHYCGGSPDARFDVANQIRAQLGWEQVNYYNLQATYV